MQLKKFIDILKTLENTREKQYFLSIIMPIKCKANNMNKSRLIKLLTTFVCKFIKEKGYISSHV
jgi:hypothetical protein